MITSAVFVFFVILFYAPTLTWCLILALYSLYNLTYFRSDWQFYTLFRKITSELYLNISGQYRLAKKLSGDNEPVSAFPRPRLIQGHKVSPLSGARKEMNLLQ